MNEQDVTSALHVGLVTLLLFQSTLKGEREAFFLTTLGSNNQCCSILAIWIWEGGNRGCTELWVSDILESGSCAGLSQSKSSLALPLGQLEAGQLLPKPSRAEGSLLCNLILDR